MTDETNIKNLRPKTEDVLSIAAKSRKQIEENPILEALTLVIESNAEYARGVTTILDSDLEREVALNEIKKDLNALKKLVELNSSDISKVSADIIKLSTNILELMEKLEKLNNEVNTNLETRLNKQLENKLSPLYVAANLQTDGKQYNPTDRLVVGFQKVLSSKISMMLVGAAIWFLIKYAFKNFTGFN